MDHTLVSGSVNPTCDDGVVKQAEHRAPLTTKCMFNFGTKRESALSDPSAHRFRTNTPVGQSVKLSECFV